MVKLWNTENITDICKKIKGINKQIEDNKKEIKALNKKI